MKSRIGFFVTLMLALWALSAQAQQHKGKFDINPPIYQQFTVTDWVDVTRLALKSTIPGGISGSIYINFTPTAPVTMRGEVFKKEKNDAGPISLGTFTTTAMNRDFTPVTGDPDGWTNKYTLTMGDLSAGAKLDIDFTESNDYKTFKDKISGGAITTITGDFAVTLQLLDGGSKLADWRFNWNVPFASDDNARIKFQGQEVVTSPTPEWLVIYPPETPDLPIEAWVVKVENNSVSSALEGRKYVLFKPQPGEFTLRYPADAPVLTPGNYAIGGRSIISTSSGTKSVSAIPFEFKVEDPAASGGGGSNSNGGNTNTGGSTVVTVDPLVAVFGSIATNIPQDFATRLTPRLRVLLENGWTFSSLRYNGRSITVNELIAQNVLASFGTNWNIYLVQ